MDLQSARAVKEELVGIFATRARGPRRRQFAIGLEPAGPQTQYAIAIRAPAPEDVSERDLAVIRNRAAGEVGVRYTGAIIPLAGSKTVTVSGPLRIGSSVAHHRCTAGTLGFFARRASDGIAGFVSNNHVLALCDQGQDGDEILYPSPQDGGSRPANVVAQLVGGYPLITRRRAQVDCAFARLLPSVDFDPLTLGAGQQLSPDATVPELSPEVAKNGRTTGFTMGRISAFEFDSLNVAYSLKEVIPFKGQIEIESIDGSPFSRGGDSGSLVYSRPGNHPVGLLFAVSATGGPSRTGLTYANHIDAVLKALDVRFL